MYYLLSVIEHDGPIPEPEVMAVIARETAAVDQAIKDAGVWVFSGPLHHPRTATVVRPTDDGETLVTDGPFTEAKEHVGGFAIVNVPDLDTALVWAREMARSTTLPIEIRPFTNDVTG